MGGSYPPLSVQSLPLTDVFRSFLPVLENCEGGTRTAWALNLLCRLCGQLTGGMDPRELPADCTQLRTAFDNVSQDMSPQVKSKALLLLRRMLQANPACEDVLRCFPRRVIIAPDPVRRQGRLVREDAIPAEMKAEWMRELFGDILCHPSSGGWKTSASARQNLSMLHKFLRSTSLTDAENREAFELKVRALSRTEVEEMCSRFTDQLCASTQSAKSYLVVFNLFFHRFYTVITEPLTAACRKRRILTLEQLDRELSSSAGSSLRGGMRTAPYLSSEEVDRLCSIASGTPREALIVGLLSTTGLRRRGLLNIRITDVAQIGADRKWMSDKGGRTMEKGRKVRTFPIFPGVQPLVEAWLNTSEASGGRMVSPSPYLFPSQRTDNGQMSVSCLDRLFKGICKRAGIDPSKAHPHIMRHTCAHRLLEMGNTSRQIAAYIGHSSSATTEKYYLRDTTENITDSMNLPWAPDVSAAAATTAPQRAKKTALRAAQPSVAPATPKAVTALVSQATDTVSSTTPKAVTVVAPYSEHHEVYEPPRKKPTRDMLRELLAIRQQRDGASVTTDSGLLVPTTAASGQP